MRGIITLLLAFCIISCSGSKTEKDLTKIDIVGNLGNSRVIPLSEIATDISYIPLETTDSSLIGNIRLVLYENGCIYIVHSGIISLFDENGKFIRNIDRRGRGPEEYTNMSVMQMLKIDPDNGNLIINSADGKFYEYKQNGDFVKCVKCPEIEGYSTFFLSGTKIDDNCYIYPISANNPQVTQMPYCAVVYDSLSNVKLMVPSPEKEQTKSPNVNSGFMMIKDIALISYFEEKARIIYANPEIVRSIGSDLKIDTLFTIDYGDYKVTPENKNQLGDFSANIISWLGPLKESRDYLYIWLNLRGLARNPVEVPDVDEKGNPTTRFLYNSYALFNKKTGDFTLMDQPIKGSQGFEEDLGNGPVFWPVSISSKEQLIAAHTALDFKTFAENNKCSGRVKEIAANLKDTDNPVIAIAKLK